MKLNTLHARVEYCLERFDETRNSDSTLLIRLAENFYPPLNKYLYSWREVGDALHLLPSLDHIARVRRKVVRENGYKKYLPTDKRIAEARKINETKWKAYAVAHNLQDMDISL